MINDHIDLAHWRERLQREGRVQVADYLQPAAERLRQCLEQEVPWTLALRDGTGARTIDHAAYAAMDEDTRSALLAQTAAGARAVEEVGGEFRFAYDSYMMVTAYQQGRDPGLLLHRVLELFNSPDYIAFVVEHARRRLGHHERDRLRAPARERARGTVRHIVERLDGLTHRRRDLGAHLRRSVDHARHRRP